ncbi:hypothetical protein GQ55_8G078000 [Panicum hallii var. hallii]|uniref:Protein kinase domain-containing protein n=1 Tax=Panicum hallii var. hallii TaxID=1504633 RepID=A0A2T7CLS2_9POAL|nr:hypothetical protein GQ55_8G078000 [Panicum hallii var. hallii]
MEVQMSSSSLGAMGSLLGKLCSLLVSPEDQLPEPLQLQKDKLELLKQDLEEINKFLVNLSWMEDPNMMVKHWMNEVRDLSYDIEDYIDKTMHSDPNTKVSSSWVDELSSFVKKAKDAHERHNRYDLGRWASDPRFVVDGQGWIPRLNGEATELVGIGDSKAQLIKQLNIDVERRLVVSIHGPVGVGKTTLAKEVYCQIGGQFQCRAFVRASKMPDTRRLLRSMIFQVQRHQRPPQGLSVQDLIDHLRKLLQQKRYLIVIDGLWETTSWDIVSSAFPEDTLCSRVLVTTDIQEVALECCDYQSDGIFTMEPLSRNDTRELLFNRAFGSNHECSEQLKEVSEEVIKKCCGFPLATLCIAQVLACDPDNSELWHHIKESLSCDIRNNLTSEDMLRGIIGLSYNSLPHHLKTCLLYFHMYPEGYMFLKTDLVKQWAAEGFIGAVAGKNTSEIAESYFDELVCRGFIQPNCINFSDGVMFYTVHYSIFEVIRCKSMEGNFNTVIDYSAISTKLSAKVRRLSIRFSNAKYATKPEGITLSPVRSLIFYGLVECLPSITEFESLRVLHLEFWGAHGDVLDLNGIDRLFQLRYLWVSTNVTVKLPTMMTALQYLETLEIYAKVTTVPTDIVNLATLQHLCLYGDINLPDGIAQMRSLRTLKSFDLSGNSEDNVRSLGELKNLHQLHLTCSVAPSDRLKRNLIALVSSLGKLGNLNSLVLAPGGSCTSIYSDCSNSVSSVPVSLQILELLPPICIFSRLPEWFGQLHNLRILKVVVTDLLRDDIDAIIGLQELTNLSLYVRKPTRESIIFKSATFPVLKYFKFRCGVLHLAFQAKAMPNLQKLKLEFNAHRGDQYGGMLAGIEHLLNLREVAARILAGAGVKESDRMAAESAFIDTISKKSGLPMINMQWVDSFHEERHHYPFSPDCSGTLGQCPASPTSWQDESRSSSSHQPLPLIPGSSSHYRQWKKGMLLGSGTLGQVYQGFNSENGQICAIKEIKVSTDDSNSKECLRQLNQEIVRLSQLSHPNIVQYYGSVLSNETLSVYLEYVSGISIHKMLQLGGPLGEALLRNYTAQILSGLAYLHGHNTVHSNIKVANILVDSNGYTIKLADFGMAKLLASFSSSSGKRCFRLMTDCQQLHSAREALMRSQYTSMKSFKGSPSWMAPEVISNCNGYKFSVDLWSLGCTILEMATAKPPWSQYERAAAIFKICNSQDIPDIPDHLSSEAKSFLKLCLQRDPAARPTAAQLMDHPFAKDHPTSTDGNNSRISQFFDLPASTSHLDGIAIDPGKTLDVLREASPDSNRNPTATVDITDLEADFSLRMAGEGEDEAMRTTTTSHVPTAADGYMWRKYGQKQAKGSENQRSYYKCIIPGCLVKKKVERSLPDGQIVEIVYKDAHNHPHVSARNSRALAQLLQALDGGGGDASDLTLGGMSGDTVATLENPTVSVGNDDVVGVRSPRSTGCSGLDKHEKDPKRMRKDIDGEGISMAGSRTVRKPRVVVQTTSDVDFMDDDGFRWRKYGQKGLLGLLGNPNPRSYYRCAMAGCPMRKHVERASHDQRVVVTTYTGKHNHDAPARWPSSLDRPPPAVANQSSGGAGQQQYARGFSSQGSVGVSSASAQGADAGSSFEVSTPDGAE